jgi:hypothetical protein
MEDFGEKSNELKDRLEKLHEIYNGNHSLRGVEISIPVVVWIGLIKSLMAIARHAEFISVLLNEELKNNSNFRDPSLKLVEVSKENIRSLTIVSDVLEAHVLKAAIEKSRENSGD